MACCHWHVLASTMSPFSGTLRTHRRTVWTLEQMSVDWAELRAPRLYGEKQLAIRLVAAADAAGSDVEDGDAARRERREAAAVVHAQATERKASAKRAARRLRLPATGAPPRAIAPRQQRAVARGTPGSPSPASQAPRLGARRAARW